MCGQNDRQRPRQRPQRFSAQLRSATRAALAAVEEAAWYRVELVLAHLVQAAHQHRVTCSSRGRTPTASRRMASPSEPETLPSPTAAMSIPLCCRLPLSWSSARSRLEQAPRARCRRASRRRWAARRAAPTTTFCRSSPPSLHVESRVTKHRVRCQPCGRTLEKRGHAKVALQRAAVAAHIVPRR